MPINNVVLVYIIGFFVGIFYFIKGLLWFKDKRLIEDIPTSTVRSIAMGFVEVNGRALPLKQSIILKGPFANKDCVHYKCTVEKLVRSGKSSHWESMKTEEKGDYFYIQDDTGKVLVNVGGAEYKVPADFQLQTGGWHEDLPDRLNEYLEANGIKTKDMLGFSYSFRFTEYDIEIGDKLYVLGTAGKNPFDDPNLFEADVEHVMIQKGDNNDKFIISEESEKELLKELTRNSLLGIFGGGALTIVCLFLLLPYFNLL